MKRLETKRRNKRITLICYFAFFLLLPLYIMAGNKNDSRMGKDVYISQRIKEAFFHSLKGTPDNCMDLSFCQKEDIPNLSDVNFTKIDNLGMSKGLARILWNAFDSDNYPQPETLEGNPSIFLFDEECRGQNYGVGTYYYST